MEAVENTENLGYTNHIWNRLVKFIGFDNGNASELQNVW